MPFEVTFDSSENLDAQFSGGEPLDAGFRDQIVVREGTFDYEELYHKPSINGVELAGNKTFDELGLAQVTAVQIAAILQS